MTQELALRGPQARLTDLTIADMLTLGKVLAASGIKDTTSQAQAVAKILYGQELGVGPMASVMGIHIIEGAPRPSANLIATLIQNSGRYDYRILQWDATICEIEFFKDGQPLAPTVTVTMAEMAKVTGKDGKRLVDGTNWKNYPDAMLFARAMSKGARAHTPGIFGGAPVYSAEEVGAPLKTDSDGVIIVDSEAVEVIAAPAVDFEPLLTEAQRTHITNLMRRMKGPERTATLAPYNVATVGDLTEAQARDLIETLAPDPAPQEAPAADPPAA